MLLYLITDRRALGEGPNAAERLVEMIGDAARAGVDLVQLRERDLAVRDLVALARDARAAVEGTATRLLVNDRFDVALAAGLHGVHLTTRSLAPGLVRAAAPDLYLGVSTHSVAEASAAELDGADLVVCGPVYDTPSKRGMGEPLGPKTLAEAAAAAAPIPVLALGGVTRENAAEAAAKTGGIAAIRLFQDAWLAGGRDGLAALAADLRASV